MTATDNLRAAILQAIKDYFQRDDLNPSSLFCEVQEMEWQDWYEILGDIEKAIQDARDVDSEEWEELAGTPGPSNPVLATLTIADAIEFILECPVNNVERVVLKVIGKRIKVDAENLPLSYSLTGARNWIELKGELNLALEREFSCRVDSEKWNELGIDRVPNVSDVISLAENAYTAGIA